MYEGPTGLTLRLKNTFFLQEAVVEVLGGSCQDLSEEVLAPVYTIDPAGPTQTQNGNRNTASNGESIE